MNVRSCSILEDFGIQLLVEILMIGEIMWANTLYI